MNNFGEHPFFNASFYVELAGTSILLAFLVVYIQLIGRGRRGTTFVDLAIIFAILFTAGGAVLGMTSDISIGYSPEFFNDPVVLAKSYISVFLFIMGMLFSDAFFQRFQQEFLRGKTKFRDPLFFIARRFDMVTVQAYMMIFLGIWLYRVFLFAAGGGASGFGGYSMAMRIPYPLVVMHYIIAPSSHFLVFYGIFRAFFSIKRNWIFMIPVVMEFSFLLLNGRRETLFGMFGVLFVFLAHGRKINFFKLGIFGIIALVFLSLYSTFYLDLRGRAIKIKKETGASAVEAMTQAATQRTDGFVFGEKEAIDEKAAYNLQSRGRIGMLWIYNIHLGLEVRHPMFGEAHFAGVMAALPRKLRPTRFWVDHAVNIQSHFGLPIEDASDNFVALGLADFGFIGPLITGLTFGIFLCWLSYLSIHYYRAEPVIAILLFSSAYTSAIAFEVSPISMFVTIRNVGVLLVGFWILRRFGFNLGRGTREVGLFGAMQPPPPGMARLPNTR